MVGLLDRGRRKLEVIDSKILVALGNEQLEWDVSEIGLHINNREVLISLHYSIEGGNVLDCLNKSIIGTLFFGLVFRVSYEGGVYKLICERVFPHILTGGIVILQCGNTIYFKEL